MTYDDFMKILDDTQSMIISKDLFKTLLDSQIPDRINAEDKKRIYDDGYRDARFEYEQKPERGYWIKHNNEGVITIQCPVCRKEYLRRLINYFNYCPFCGQHLLEKDTKGIYRKKGEAKDETYY